jgi:hypothetical protein
MKSDYTIVKKIKKTLISYYIVKMIEVLIEK